MSSYVTEFHNIKYIVSAAGVLIALLFDRKLGPAEDDLPLRFKIILAAPVVVAVFYSQTFTAYQKIALVPYAFGLLLFSITIYMIMWSLFGFKKVIVIDKKWWKPFAAPYTYQDTRVMGGRLSEQAKRDINMHHTSVQEYFEGTAYDQDLVWTRGSRALRQVILVLSYVSAAFFFTGTIALTLT